VTDAKREAMSEAHASAPAREGRQDGAGRVAGPRYILGLYIGRIGILVGVVVIWWALVSAGVLSTLDVGSPYLVGQYVVEQFWREIVPNALDTLWATLIAFALSGVFGVLGGYALVEFPYVKRMIDPILNALNSMPRIALAPLFILWFGIGIESKVALAFSLGFFMVLMNTYAGVRNVDPILVRLSCSLGCTGWQQFTKITLPWAVPSVFAGLRLALIYSFLGVVTSGMIASKSGLGQLIMFYSGVLRMDAVIAILIIMGLMAVTLMIIADKVEARLLGSWTEPLGGNAHE